MGKGKMLTATVRISGGVEKEFDNSVKNAGTRLEKLSDAAGKTQNAMNKAAEGFTVAKGALAHLAADGIEKAIGALKDFTGSVFETGISFSSSLSDIQSQTGATAAEMEALGGVMQGIYKDNYGESFEDVADAVSDMSKMTKLAGQDLQNVTEDAFALRDTFGYEVTESARAAKAMMTNFGVSGEEAMNLIAVGAQNGLDYSGELIDSINEYSVQFAKLGFTAEDMFKIYQQGADSGAWNLDKVGDAIKEFSIRSIDGSATSQTAFEALGYNANEMFEVFTKGGDEASGAFHELINRLMDMDDKVARDAAGVGLFGTMWEDLGTDAMQALADMEAGAYVAGDELERIQEIKYDNLQNDLEEMSRDFDAMRIEIFEGMEQPLRNAVAVIVQNVIPKLQVFMDKAVPVFGTVAESIAATMDVGISFVDKCVTFIGNNIEWLLPIISGLTAAFVAYKAITIAVITWETIKAAALMAGTGATSAAAVATWALGGAMAFLTSPIFIVIAAIAALTAAGVWLYRNWDKIKEKAAQLGEFLSGVWSSIKEKVTAFITAIKNAFITGFGALVGIVMKPFNTILSLVDKVKGSVGRLWDKITGAKKDAASINVPAYATGGFTDGISIAGEAGTEAIISFDPAYRSQNLSYWAKAGQMLGADTEGFTLSENGSETNVTDVGGITFAPNITIEGNADKNDIIQAIRESYPEFLDLLKEVLSGEGDFVYG